MTMFLSWNCRAAEGSPMKSKIREMIWLLAASMSRALAGKTESILAVSPSPSTTAVLGSAEGVAFGMVPAKLLAWVKVSPGFVEDSKEKVVPMVGKDSLVVAS